ncbi:hypothetical protein L5515_015737 [Caenorhabditis briggsae]|uniref:Lin-66-like winged helix domain-containing protein n=2 Tax=Caenorhabditis briggsae TaxID=6238 RepID=A0AAE9EGN2_CAEBR|nr:hypothetical protein L5515_015737 [Caenorhabditis briggsae]
MTQRVPYNAMFLPPQDQPPQDQPPTARQLFTMHDFPPIGASTPEVPPTSSQAPPTNQTHAQPAKMMQQGQEIQEIQYNSTLDVVTSSAHQGHAHSEHTFSRSSAHFREFVPRSKMVEVGHAPAGHAHSSHANSDYGYLGPTPSGSAPSAGPAHFGEFAPIRQAPGPAHSDLLSPAPSLLRPLPPHLPMYAQQNYQKVQYPGNLENSGPNYFLGAESSRTMRGHGVLTWLSPKAGILKTSDNRTVSFQANVFCDPGLNDLTHCLHVGFTLKFVAQHSSGTDYSATHVSPFFGYEAKEIFRDSKNPVDLDSFLPPGARGKLEYNLDLEFQAYEAFLAAFEKLGSCRIPLNSFHSQMSNTIDEPLFRYIGTSAMKRRNFVERRTHLFCLQSDDSMILQYPTIYRAVLLLSNYLLRHGGVMAIEDLYAFFTEPGKVDPSILTHIGADRPQFMQLLSAHPYIFSIFPNRAFVAARRNLPDFDYPGFVNRYFPDLMPRPQRVQQAPPTAPPTQREAVPGGFYEYGHNVNTWIQNVAQEVGGAHEQLSREFAHLLSLKNPIGAHPKCTCKCSCGAMPQGAAQAASIPDSGIFGSVRAPSNDTAGSSEDPNPRIGIQNYNLFGADDPQGGNFDALRFGNF